MLRRSTQFIPSRCASPVRLSNHRTLATLRDTPNMVTLIGPDLRETVRNMNCKHIWEMALHTSTEFGVRSFSSANEFPGNACLVLNAADASDAQDAAVTFAKQWDNILRWESRALTQPAYARVLASISWRTTPLARLFFEFCRMARNNAAYMADVTHIANAVTMSLLDEKGPEDLHGHVKDL